MAVFVKHLVISDVQVCRQVFKQMVDLFCCECWIKTQIIDIEFRLGHKLILINTEQVRCNTVAYGKFSHFEIASLDT